MAIPLGLAKAQGHKLGQPTFTGLKLRTMGNTDGPLKKLISNAEAFIDSLPDRPPKRAKKNRHRSFKSAHKK